MKTRAEQEQKFWDSFAIKYDDLINNRAFKTYKVLYKFLLADTMETKHLLEIATGTGIHSIDLCKQIPKITATDLSPEMLKIAIKKSKENNITNINFLAEDSCNLSFPDKSFDTILASNVLHLLYKPDWAMMEMKRVLKDNGKIIIPTYCHGQNLFTHIISRLMSLSGFRARSRWSVKGFKKFLNKNGFELIKFEKIKDTIPLVYAVVQLKN